MNQFPFCLPCLGFAKKSKPQRVWGDHGFPLLVVACLHCAKRWTAKARGLVCEMPKSQTGQRVGVNVFWESNMGWTGDTAKAHRSVCNAQRSCQMYLHGIHLLCYVA